MIFAQKPLILHDNSAEMMWPHILLFGISGGEILILLLLVLILFGPKKIPEIARMVGKGMNEVKKVQREINTEISRYSSEIDNEVRKMEPDERKKLSEPEKAQMADKKQDPYYSGVYPAGEQPDKVDGKFAGTSSASADKEKVKSAGSAAPSDKVNTPKASRPTEKAKATSPPRQAAKARKKSDNAPAQVEKARKTAGKASVKGENKAKSASTSGKAAKGKPKDKVVPGHADKGSKKGSGKKDNSGKA